MKASLAKHLLQSPDVRVALKREAWRLIIFIAIYVVTMVVVRYLREKPMVDAVWSAVLGAMTVAVVWLVSALRTLRAVLREHGLLAR